jgi:lambda family phage portal protein
MTEAKRGRGRPPSLETVAARAAVAAIDAIARGANRHVSPKARYDAAGRGRRMAGWNAPTSGPNIALAGLQTIRDRSRDAYRNEWSGRSGVQKWETALIGIGIVPRFRRVADKTRRMFVTDLFDDFVKKCDADCVLNYYALQTLVVRTWLMAGECFVRRRSRFPDEGLPVSMQIQVLEPEMVPLLDSDFREGLPANHYIKSGIEFNKRGKRIAYWVYKVHPGDGDMRNIGADELVRVAASEMCHIYLPDRAGQLRGVSELAAILARLKNVENYDDNTLTRQQLANMVVGFITKALPTLDGETDIDPMTNMAVARDPLGTPLVGMQPGLIQELDEGEKIEWSNPPEAGTNYSEYMRTQHMGTASGQGLPYELFSGDIREVSDRTLRVIINEFRRYAEQRQWQHVIPQFCQPVIDWFADAALLDGLITLDEHPLVKRVEHAPHGWAYIHPVQDPQGKALEVTNGFRSRSSVIGERGDDPEQVDEERAADAEREEDLGLPISGQPTPAAGDNDGIDNEEYNAPPNAPGAKARRAPPPSRRKKVPA